VAKKRKLSMLVEAIAWFIYELRGCNLYGVLAHFVISIPRVKEISDGMKGL